MSDPKFYCRAEDLAIGYGKTPLMEHIGLGVGKGTILTLIGPNGAGKSTLLKTLAAQLAPQGGAVLLDGKDLADCSGPERARKMALMVPHTRRTELTTCFEMASAGRYPYTGRLWKVTEQANVKVLKVKLCIKHLVAFCFYNVGYLSLPFKDYDYSSAQLFIIVILYRKCQFKYRVFNIQKHIFK